jgi:hypothetical protein
VHDEIYEFEGGAVGVEKEDGDGAAAVVSDEEVAGGVVQGDVAGVAALCA